MNRYQVDLLDLPNEILMIILKKLDNIDMFCSLFNINNQRLHNVIEDENFSNTFNLASIVHKSTIFDLFCSNILPKICFNVKFLIVESSSMERILRTAHYPNLAHLKIFKFKGDDSLHYFTDDSSFQHIFKKQIKKLELVHEDYNKTEESITDYPKQVYAHILNYFENLEYLNVTATLITSDRWFNISGLSPDSFFSSTLTYLCINVLFLTDCLYLLDGRLKQLRTFIVKIRWEIRNLAIVHNMDDLPNLKCFSLIYDSQSEAYSYAIRPLLRRMINLEKLTLYLYLVRRNVFTDPICILKELVTHMSRLHSLKYYIGTENSINDLTDHLSKNDIEQNYIGIGSQEILNFSCFTCLSGVYHVFTLPFEFHKIMYVGNKFPNITFNYVIELLIHDVVQFEHEFFLRISKAFPLLEKLSVTDSMSPRYIINNSSDNIEPYEIVEYPHLTILYFRTLRIHYTEQFLNETRTNLPCLRDLNVLYEELRITTEDFTREVTRRNCSNVKRLVTGRHIVGSKDYYNYFPLLFK